MRERVECACSSAGVRDGILKVAWDPAPRSKHAAAGPALLELSGSAGQVKARAQRAPGEGGGKIRVYGLSCANRPGSSRGRGEPVFKGTRVTLRTVLASLAEGATTAEILADFPTLSEEDIRAAIVGWAP